MRLGIIVPDKQVFPLAALRLDRGGTPDVPGLLILFRVCYLVLRLGAEQGDGAVPALLVCAPLAGESITVIPVWQMLLPVGLLLVIAVCQNPWIDV